jgi:hypothetical protein
MMGKKQLFLFCFIFGPAACLYTMELAKKINFEPDLEKAALSRYPEKVDKLLLTIPSQELYTLLHKKNGIIDKITKLAAQPTWALKRRGFRLACGTYMIGSTLFSVCYYIKNASKFNRYIDHIHISNYDWKAFNCSSLDQLSYYSSECNEHGVSGTKFFRTTISWAIPSISIGLLQWYQAIVNSDGLKDQEKYQIILSALRVKQHELAAQGFGEKKEQ